MSTVRPSALVMLALAAFSAMAPAFAADSAVVLMYHRFDEPQYPSTSVKREQFAAHLEYLSEGGFEVIELTRLLEARQKGEPLPERALVITIDDAYRSVYDVAHPMLAARSFPYTVFVASDAVDKGLPAYMSWAQMRELEAGGASFANHGAAHRSVLDGRAGRPEDDWLAEVRADIEKGRQRLVEELNPISSAFAYPYGDYDEKSGDLVRELGYFGFGQNSGAVGPHSENRALPRYAINETYGEIGQFRTKAASIDLPVARVSPWQPLTDNRTPVISVRLAGDVERLQELACYVGGQGRVDIEWSEAGREFTVGPKNAFRNGRQRVNCTVPSRSGRYRWFSHQWFIVDEVD